MQGIEADEEVAERYAEATLATATALNPHIGYDRATEIVNAAADQNRPLREVAREMGVSEEILERALDHRKLARPHDAPGPFRSACDRYRSLERVTVSNVCTTKRGGCSGARKEKQWVKR